MVKETHPTGCTMGLGPCAEGTLAEARVQGPGVPSKSSLANPSASPEAPPGGQGNPPDGLPMGFISMG
jgi:hypothetical protein